VVSLETAPDGLDAVLKEWNADTRVALRLTTRRLANPPAVLPRPGQTTGPDGRFRLTGLGRERLAVLRIEGPTIERQTVWVATRPGIDAKRYANGGRPVTMPGMLVMVPMKLYGPSFEHAAGPTRPIEGIVRDARTGKPLAGVGVNGGLEAGLPDSHARTQTDENGRYRLVGLPKVARYRINLFPPAGSRAYLPAGGYVSDAVGLGPLTADFTMARGVLVKGRVTDRATGQPVQASLQCVPLADNKFFAETPGTDVFRFSAIGYGTDPDGRFEIIALPGSNLVLATARDQPNHYTQARLRPEDRAKTSQDDAPDEIFLGAGGNALFLVSSNAYKLIDPPADAESITLDVQFDRGRAVSGTVRGPDGQPLSGARVVGLTEVMSQPETLKGPEFRADALDPAHPRTLEFLHRERKLVGSVTVRGDEKEPPAVTLQPWGVLTGRVLDPEGRPAAGATIYAAYRGRRAGTLLLRGQSPTARRFETDADGRFRIEGLIPGEVVELRFRKPYMRSAADQRVGELTLSPGETKDLGEVRLQVMRE
jgi:protocatechuate 3,4-dioxygenase beta subunit